MEKYSPGPFQITEYKITTTKKNNQDANDIADVWVKFVLKNNSVSLEKSEK